MYKLTERNNGVYKDGAFIPFDQANADYQQFKADVLAGAVLEDADGVPMSPEAANAFIATLP